MYIITPSCHSVKYFFEGNFWEIVFKGFRGGGIAIGAASRQGSEGSEGSARFQQAGSKGVVSPDGDEYEVSVTGFPLVLQCCIMESRSPLPQEGGGAIRRRRIEASILGKKFGPILRASPSSFLGKEPALRKSPSYCISHAKHGGSENHKTGPAARRKCTPSAYGTSPRERVHVIFRSLCSLTNHVRLPPRRGRFALRSASELINISRHSAAKTSPSGVHSEHICRSASDAQNVVSRFTFRWKSRRRRG